MRRIARFLLRLIGFELFIDTENFPKKCVIIVVPHTSNWDFPIGILTRNAAGLMMHYVGKKSLFRPPFGFIFRWLGGYPIDRSKRTNTTQAIIDIYAREEEFRLTIAPEGTRKKVKRWKTGFYRIAMLAQVPIFTISVHYMERCIYFKPVLHPTGDMESEIALLRSYFDAGRGRNAELG